MRLSATDIRQQQFAVKLLRGFDPQEVDAFLDEMADSWDELNKENNLLKEQLTIAEEQKKATEEQNKSLQQTLVVAQKMAEEFRESSSGGRDRPPGGPAPGREAPRREAPGAVPASRPTSRSSSSSSGSSRSSS